MRMHRFVINGRDFPVLAYYVTKCFGTYHRISVSARPGKQSVSRMRKDFSGQNLKERAKQFCKMGRTKIRQPAITGQCSIPHTRLTGALCYPV